MPSVLPSTSSSGDLLHARGLAVGTHRDLVAHLASRDRLPNDLLHCVPALLGRHRPAEDDAGPHHLHLQLQLAHALVVGERLADPLHEVVRWLLALERVLRSPFPIHLVPPRPPPATPTRRTPSRTAL